MKEAEENYRDYCRTSFPSPPVWLIVLVGFPILLAVAVIARIPWFIGLKIMVADAKLHGWYRSDPDTMLQAFLWWITPQRLAYYFILRMIRRCVVRFLLIL